MHDESLFGRIAVEEGFLSQEQLDRAKGELNGKALADALVTRGILTAEQVQVIRDIQRIHMAELTAPAESGGLLKQDRFMLPCSGCETYYLIQGYAEGTKFICRKCKKLLVVRRVAGPQVNTTSKARMIGPYELQGEVGRGSMSVVYKAQRKDTGRVVALKVLKESDTPNPRLLRRFQQEARTASRLHHPNIVAVHEAGEIDGAYFIAMDLVEGVTLDRALGGGRLRLREFVRVLEEVARAIHYAHQQGIVHRDLKPANILLDASNKPHVTDFGLAKMEQQDKSATQAGDSLGTPFYMSPEQVEGNTAATDARSDIYALGVMLYEGLTGRVPYPGPSVVDVYRGIMSGSFPLPTALIKTVPPELETVCLKALERDKQRRPSNGLEFADELRRWLDIPVIAPARKAQGG